VAAKPPVWLSLSCLTVAHPTLQDSLKTATARPLPVKANHVIRDENATLFQRNL
jgi:hypothetical protein